MLEDRAPVPKDRVAVLEDQAAVPKGRVAVLEKGIAAVLKEGIAAVVEHGIAAACDERAPTAPDREIAASLDLATALRPTPPLVPATGPRARPASHPMAPGRPRRRLVCCRKNVAAPAG